MRRCLGASFAQFEMKIVLQEVVKRLDLRAADPRPEPRKRRAITLVPGRGGEVVATPLERAGAAPVAEQAAAA